MREVIKNKVYALKVRYAEQSPANRGWGFGFVLVKKTEPAAASMKIVRYIQRYYKSARKVSFIDNPKHFLVTCHSKELDINYIEDRVGSLDGYVMYYFGTMHKGDTIRNAPMREVSVTLSLLANKICELNENSGKALFELVHDEAKAILKRAEREINELLSDYYKTINN